MMAILTRLLGPTHAFLYYDPYDWPGSVVVPDSGGDTLCPPYLGRWSVIGEADSLSDAEEVVRKAEAAGLRVRCECTACSEHDPVGSLTWDTYANLWVCEGCGDAGSSPDGEVTCERTHQP